MHLNYKYDPNNPIPYKQRISNNPGVKISWYGDTPMTSSDSDCGFTSIGNLVPYKIANTKGT